MTLNSSETAQEYQQFRHAAEADRYLDRGATEHTDSAGRQALAQVGIGQALLALGDMLDGRLADIADAVTGVQDQVGDLAEMTRPPRRWRWGRGRGAARPAPGSADAAVIRRALADAIEWRLRDDQASAVDERAALEYGALRDRLGGCAS